ncbi:DUF1569 domain-containing protein [Aquimarina muelleri]|uniref:DUF1569 domain-containing protein n=1 Tax=Aquimarina muelleri TaxID=279356 RepID=A0A918JVN1_9FLAO|nr:DUF1569 domain-containing protein [Aquimarina muelleri]MCX2762161.1 DUF1569 domain-containing protein [Aquimarina muelleri]GGX16898.1 hypothetical protein GCM10007384_18080 [Aquimarina muelleri]
MKSLFDKITLNEIENRIHKLSDTSIPIWGKMDVSQMFYHCQFPLKIALQKEQIKLKPNFFAKLFFKKTMYSDKPWRKNLPTHSKLKVVDSKNFNTEKESLLELVNDFSNQRDRKEWAPHPMFGKFTYEQWGKMQYKHLDHHLQQFNV